MMTTMMMMTMMTMIHFYWPVPCDLFDIDNYQRLVKTMIFDLTCGTSRMLSSQLTATTECSSLSFSCEEINWDEQSEHKEREQLEPNVIQLHLFYLFSLLLWLTKLIALNTHTFTDSGKIYFSSLPRFTVNAAIVFQWHRREKIKPSERANGSALIDKCKHTLT